MNDDSQFEPLRRRLTGERLGDDEANELVEAVASLQRLGIPVKPLTKGTPQIDGLVIHASIQPDRLADVVRSFADSRILESLRLFPEGILDPEVFHARIELRL